MKKIVLIELFFILTVNLASAGGNNEVRWFDAKRVVQEITMEYSYSPEEIFPLLCPVREYEWMASWKGTIAYTDSGFAEKYVIFYHSIPFPLIFEKAYWIATQYNPPEYLQWCVTVPGLFIIVIDEKMTALEGSKTVIDYIYTVTALSETGNKMIEEKFSREALMKEQIRTKDEIEYYLKTGKMLGTEYKSDMFN